MRTELVVAAVGTLLLGGVIWAANQQNPVATTPSVPSDVAPTEAIEAVAVAEPEPEVEAKPDEVAIAVTAGDVPFLTGFASTGSDLDRGRAVVGLLDLGTPEAKASLMAIQADETQSKLVRTWAVASRIQLIEDRTELFEPGWNLAALPEAREPFKKKAAALYADETNASTLLRAIRFNPELSSTLQARVVEASPRSLVRVMLTADDQQHRRDAAAYTGAAVKVHGYKAVAKAVVDGLAFDGDAAEEPWEGGPLWIPSLGWEQAEAQGVVEALSAWRISCQGRGDTACTRQVDNNLRSVGLTRAAGRR